MRPRTKSRIAMRRLHLNCVCRKKRERKEMNKKKGAGIWVRTDLPTGRLSALFHPEFQTLFIPVALQKAKQALQLQKAKLELCSYKRQSWSFAATKGKAGALQLQGKGRASSAATRWQMPRGIRRRRSGKAAIPQGGYSGY